MMVNQKPKKEITELKRVEEALKECEATFRALTETAACAIYICQGDKPCYVNPAATAISGYSREELLAMTFWDTVHPDFQEIVRDRGLARQQGIPAPSRYEVKFITKSGEERWAEINATFIEFKGRPAKLGMTFDITERKRVESALLRAKVAEAAKQELEKEVIERKHAEEAARKSEERYRALVEQASDGIFISDLQGNYLDMNTSGCSMFGYSREEILRMCISDMVFSEDHLAMYQALEDLRLGKSTVTEWRLKRKDGTTIPIEVSAKMLPGGYLQGIARDATERKRAEKQLLHNAVHDALTDLPNRTLFMERLRRAVEHSKRHKNYLFAVLFLDLDRFKLINDSLGHLLGDQLLIAIACRLKACLRATDIAARLGGDEFTILLEGIKDISDAIHVADRIQQELAMPFDLAGQEVFTTASIGITLSATGYDRPEDLLRDADIAVYRAKALGKARYEIFNTSMHAIAVARLQLETDLRRAVERQEFEIHYQPIVALDTGLLTGFEALVRWQHPIRGLIHPTDFISVAVETGLSVPIDQWVFAQACRQIQQWQKQFPDCPPLTISVNVCSRQFAHPELINHIDQILQETNIDAHCFKLEITESIIMENSESATVTLSQLRDLGIQLSIDDFGTGYSSLGRLHHFPINMLKIDRSFVSRMGFNSGNLEIVETILTLAQKLGVDVTAEGVETAEQLAQLRELKCEYGQGYFFSQPLDTKATEALILAKPKW